MRTTQYKYPMHKVRKASFRFMLLGPDNESVIVTQDSRRSKNFITGCVQYPASVAPRMMAKLLGCSVIVRHKVYVPSQLADEA